MLIITIAYIIGIIMGLYLHINIALFIFAISSFGTVILLSIYLISKKRIEANLIENKAINKSDKLQLRTAIIIAITCVVFVVISFINVKLRENNFNNLYSYSGQSIEFVGTVIGLKRESKYYDSYVIEVNNVNEDNSYANITNFEVNNTVEANAAEESDKAKKDIIGKNDIKKSYKGAKILLRIKKSKSTQTFKYGELIYGNGTLEKPEKRKNYKGFDYSQYLKTKGICMICITDSDKVKSLNEKSNNDNDNLDYISRGTANRNPLLKVNVCIFNVKTRITNNLIDLLPQEEAAIAIALFLGDSTMLDEKQKSTFSDASLSHVLAVSGMHVAYVISGVTLITSKMGKRKSKYILIFSLIFFCQLTGGSPSVCRAVIMGILMIVSKLIYRKSDTLNNISLACLIIILCNPYYILNLGFQLSFLGTLGIVLFNSKVENQINKIPAKIRSIVAVSISANILIIPVLMYYFNTFSLIFLISNLLVTVILSAMFFCGYITVIVSLFSVNIAELFAYVLKLSIMIFEKIATISSNIPFVRFTVVTPNFFEIMVYYLFIFYLFYFYKKKHKRALAKGIVVLAAILVIIMLIGPINPKLKLYFVDVGQGDCSLIVTGSNKTILIDGGGSEASNYDVGENILVPYLLDRRITTIDFMIFSHFDSDHCKGLFTVMQNLKVKNAIISEQGEDSENFRYFLKLAQERKVNIVCVQTR